MRLDLLLRAAAAPELFLEKGGFARFVAQHGSRGNGLALSALRVVPPADLGRFLTILAGGEIAGFVSRVRTPSFKSAIVKDEERAYLIALLAGALPFGRTYGEDGAPELVAYFVAEAPAKGLIVTLKADPTSADEMLSPRIVCRSTADLAVICAIQAMDEELEPPSFSLADDAFVHVLIERATHLATALTSDGPRARAALHALSFKPIDVPPVEVARKKPGRIAPLAVGALVEAFLREPDAAVLAKHLADHAESADAVVREAVLLLTGKGELAQKLVARRARALRGMTPAPEPERSIETTRRIIAHYDTLPPTAETAAAVHERDETLAALSELGEPSIAPELVERALHGDAAAVDLLGALGDRSLVDHALGGALLGERRARLFDAAIVRMIMAVAPREASPLLRRLLAENAMTNWREGIERGALVRELVTALGDVRDHGAAPLLAGILESTSQEYRTILPLAAWALGRLEHAPALPILERLLASPKDAVSSETIWAIGEIARANGEAPAVLDALTGLEPGAELTRLVARMKLGRDVDPSLVRTAIARALWEPAFRQEETARRQVLTFRALEELPPESLIDPRTGDSVIDHETIRYFVTRDDVRVRKAAERAFTVMGLPLPKVRAYFAHALPDSLDALHEAVRDPLGLFRHNVATQLAAIGDPRSVLPLAEATSRLFAEPPTSTYEYDDAPPTLARFVRALASFNDPDGNDVLVEGFHSENPHVRGVIAEHAPNDPRFIPELMAMLGDPRSFLRARAEKSLTARGAIPAPIDLGNSTEIVLPTRVRLEG